MELSLSDLFVHPVVLFAGLALGALGVWFAMPRAARAPRELGAVVAAAGLGLVFLAVLITSGLDAAPNLFFYVFAAIGLGSALRVITHPRPVYSALFFILTILSSSGLYVLLSAEFLTFALVIIYAGAILITYLFVIMLATQAPSENAPQAPEESDAVARHPAGAVFAGFLLLAALTGLFNSSLRTLPEPTPVAADAVLTRLPLKIKRELVAMGFPDTVQVGSDTSKGLMINPSTEPRTLQVQVGYRESVPFIKSLLTSYAQTLPETRRTEYLSRQRLVRDGVAEPLFAVNDTTKPLDHEVFDLFQIEGRPFILLSEPRPRDHPAGAPWTPGHWILACKIPDSVEGVNLEAVGFALLAEHPLALELAGVILLMALVGAVVIARKQIEHSESETAAAARSAA